MHFTGYVGPILDAVHWTATIVAGMLAVMFVCWAFIVTAPAPAAHKAAAPNGSEQSQVIYNPDF